MRFKDLAVGKYVVLNRWLSKYYILYCETLEIVSLPDTKEDGEVGCRRVTQDGCVCTNNKYADGETRYIKYIHLREVNVDPYACLKWNRGDVLVPTEIGVDRLSKPQLNRSPYVVVDGTIRYDRYRDRNDLKVYIAPSNGGTYSMSLNVAYFKKDDKNKSKKNDNDTVIPNNKIAYVINLSTGLRDNKYATANLAKASYNPV